MSEPIKLELSPEAVQHLNDCVNRADGGDGFIPDPDECGFCREISEAVHKALRERSRA